MNTLFIKFESDINNKSRAYRFLLVIDQMCNVLFWNGSQDETVSSHINRKIQKGTATWFDKKLCCILKLLDRNHCEKSLGE